MVVNLPCLLTQHNRETNCLIGSHVHVHVELEQVVFQFLLLIYNISAMGVGIQTGEVHGQY